MAASSRCMRCRCCDFSQVLDGFDQLLVHLDFSAAQGEALGSWSLLANAHDGCHGITGAAAVQCHLNGEIKPHVQVQNTATADQLKQLLLMCGIKYAVLTSRMGEGLEVNHVAQVAGAIGDFLDEVRQLEVRLRAVVQGQRVPFAA